MEIYKNYLKEFMYIHQELKSIYIKDMYNIAFRYEQRLYINERRFAPDFKILLPDGSIFYWEHVGLTNDKWYMHDHSFGN